MLDAHKAHRVAGPTYGLHQGLFRRPYHAFRDDSKGIPRPQTAHRLFRAYALISAGHNPHLDSAYLHHRAMCPLALAAVADARVIKLITDRWTCPGHQLRRPR